MNMGSNNKNDDCSHVTEDNFRSWNENMIGKYDPDVYHTQSNFFIQIIIKLLCISMMKSLNLQCRDNVLEVGCGAGNVLEKLSCSKNLVGIDISLKLLQKTRRRCSANVGLIASNAEGLPFRSESFNKVLCTEVVEHLLEPENCLSEIRRIAKDDATIVISTTNEPFVNKLKAIIWRCGFNRILFRRDAYKPQERMDDEWHLHAFDPDSFKQILEKYFFVEKITFVPSIIFPVQMVAKCVSKR